MWEFFVLLFRVCGKSQCGQQLFDGTLLFLIKEDLRISQNSDFFVLV